MLRETGVDILVDNREIAVMGLVEVIKHYPKIRRALKTMEEHLHKAPPDLLILVDYVEFNLKLAKTAKSLGIKVLFYVSPQIWAWRPGRVKKIGTVIDMMATIFPFEVKYYEEANIPARYVGHPLVGKVHASADRETLLAEFKLNPNAPVVSLQPGSRRGEIDQLLEPFIETAIKLKERDPSIQFILPLAPGLDMPWLYERLAAHKNMLKVTLLQPGRSYDAMSMAHVVLSASGTATLETTMMGTPMVVAHRISPISYQIFKRLIRIPHISLANIVAQREIVKEFIQDAVKPENIAAEIERLLVNTAYRDQMVRDMHEVTEKLGHESGSLKVAALAAEMLSG
ncbi:unnamed protein product [Cyprideis torosa]|uniref:lipid-A-disaccharide synthase n=1 Tax=Cyprideis torosa TaxID=163714 RepID=A0A7R8ZYZ4_9CRUS|nr:unnamed protein product [Cyprideis torosa]CAG0909194.1 unnamed protein product [Cyprideis torosa]